MKSVIVRKTGEIESESNLDKYEVLVLVDGALVHRETFIDPEFAEFYAEQYVSRVWGNTKFEYTATVN